MVHSGHTCVDSMRMHGGWVCRNAENSCVAAVARAGGTALGTPAEDVEGRECVICMSAPRDTTVLPCRHMCICKACAEALRNQTNKCPICRKSMESLLHIKQ